MDLRESITTTPYPGLAKKYLPSSPVEQSKDQGRLSVNRMISVIIPAHNEEDYLGPTLDALHRQNYPWVELIVVANGCVDHTANVARGRCHRLIVLSQRNLGIARNLGARMARGDLLVFLDADTTLEPMALRVIAQKFSTTDAAGTLKGRPDSDRFGCRSIYQIKNFLHRYAVHRGSSGIIICWRKDFIGSGGFDERLEVRENSELIGRLLRGGKYKYIDEATVTTSMRRYNYRGLARMAWFWMRLWVQSMFGDLHDRHYEPIR